MLKISPFFHLFPTRLLSTETDVFSCSYTDRRVRRGVLKIENAKVLNFDGTERDKSFALLRYNARAGRVT